MNRLSKIIVVLLLVTGCVPLDWDTPYGHAFMKSSKFPSGRYAGKYCASWHYYHYYRSYCKSQKCLDLYEKKKPVATIRSCQKRAASHGADTSNFLTEEEIEALELELRKDMCRHSGEWIKSDPTFCARHGIKKEAR